MSKVAKTVAVVAGAVAMAFAIPGVGPAVPPLFFATQHGHIEVVEEFDAVSDAAALDSRFTYAGERPVELWCGDRRVGRMEARDRSMEKTVPSATSDARREREKLCLQDLARQLSLEHELWPGAIWKLPARRTSACRPDAHDILARGVAANDEAATCVR
jgi:hypothetical protein